jgi:hypothetical protein
MTRLFASTFFCALLSVAGPAAAALVTYDVDLNFDPTTQEGGTGVGTVKGTFTLNTSTDTITAIDLIEKTNTTDTIGGGFGSPTFTTVEFNTLSLTSIDFSDASSPLVRTQSDCCLFDGIEVGPGLQFDFPYPGGGDVTPGNFASITSESRYLYGSVTPTAAPEPSTWAMMLLGFAGLGFAGYRSRKAASIAGRVIG